MNEYIDLGKRIYQHRDRTDFNVQRLVVFLARAFLNQKEITALHQFFLQNANLAEIEKGNAIFYEQLTRHVFYHKSTMQERLALIEQHFNFCLDRFTEAALPKIYYDQRLILWEIPYKDDLLSIGLDFKYADRKEGLISMDLQFAEKRIYHITFWFCQDENQEVVMKIGALQGSYRGSEIIHELTKDFFGYRPKNLILYAVRVLAQSLNVDKIYAVSNLGFFTNTHVRMDRKLKVSLDDFWLEIGGSIKPDARFFSLPLFEKRKSIEEVKSQKRNLYRKRYKVLDEIETEVRKRLHQYIK